MAPSRVALLAACLAALAAAGPAAAKSPKDDAAPELSVRIEKLRVDYVLGDDGRRVETRETAMKLLREDALGYARQAHVGYSTSIETRRRPRGVHAQGGRAARRGAEVELPARHQQGPRAGRPAFSDRTRLTVVFPEVAVGDTLVLKYRVTRDRADVPGALLRRRALRARYAATTTSTMRIDAPASLWTQFAVTDMKETVNETQRRPHASSSGRGSTRR